MHPVILRLLNETIARAHESSAYYRAVFNGLDLEIKSASDLMRLPLLKREAVVEHGRDLLSDGAVPACVNMTGGTTFAAGGSRPLLFYKSQSDIEARERLIDSLYECYDVRPLLMHLVNMGHGVEPGGAKNGCFQLPLERAHHFATILSLLRDEFSFDGYERRITLLASPLRLLKALTLLCIESGISGSDFAITLVSSSSDQLTPRWRSVFAAYWGASVDETYGLSEIPGLHATRCMTCGHFHFSPFAVPEVLSLDGDDHVERGVGQLVATALYPLSSLQPLIRYATGDLIEVFAPCTSSESFGFEFLGRLSQCILLRRDRGLHLVLAPRTVNEVLDSIPGIAEHQHTFAKVLGVRSATGGPRWTMRAEVAGDDRIVVRIVVELYWSPAQFPRAAEELREEISGRIIDAAPGLQTLMATKEVDLQIKMTDRGAAASENAV